MPIGPILQALWQNPQSACQFNYRRCKTREIIQSLRDNAGILPAYEDFFHGSDYLEQVQNGNITDNDIVLMFSIDGAQLYTHKMSDCWIYIWVILDFSPQERYKKDFVIPGGFIPGPKKPKNLDSFLFPGLYHLASLQREGLPIWNSIMDQTFLSRLFLGLNTADGPADTHEQHAQHGCSASAQSPHDLAKDHSERADNSNRQTSNEHKVD